MDYQKKVSQTAYIGLVIFNIHDIPCRLLKLMSRRLADYFSEFLLCCNVGEPIFIAYQQISGVTTGGFFCPGLLNSHIIFTT